MNEQLNRIEDKIDKLSDKISSHGERLSVVETKLKSVKGYITVSTTMFLAIVGTLALTYWDKVVAIILQLK